MAAIPARYASTRLPGKVLLEVAGRPLVEHVYRRALAAEGLDEVVVLTDDERVARAVASFGGRCEMTPAECVSGTDRVAAAARSWGRNAAVINLQADEPLIDPAAVGRLAAHLRAAPADGLATLAAPADSADADDPNAVKVVLDADGYALYFSRAAIPHDRAGTGTERLRHIGIYGYQLSTLLHLAALPPSPLERAESLEQLRALENGIRIRVLTVERAWPGVDTADDLARVAALLETLEPQSTKET